jgi:hypothetical protein
MPFLFSYSLALIILIPGIIAFGRQWDDYSHIRDTISRLGEQRAPQAFWVRWGIFFPVGLFLLALSYTLFSKWHAAAILSLSLGIGYLISAPFPCDHGCPLSGTLAQWIHNLGGAVMYGGSLWSLWELAKFHGHWLIYVDIIAGLSVLGVATPVVWSYRGLAQRIAEVIFFGALGYALLMIY